MKYGKFIDKLSNCEIFKKGSALWTLLLSCSYRISAEIQLKDSGVSQQSAAEDRTASCGGFYILRTIHLRGLEKFGQIVLRPSASLNFGAPYLVNYLNFGYLTFLTFPSTASKCNTLLGNCPYR
jgi:hypothetical protein